MTTPDGSGDPFLGVNVKINRGDEHLQTLNDEIQEWGQPESYEFFGEHSEDRKVYMLGVRFQRQPDFAKWAAMTGDALANYRSALDYIVYALAVTDTRSDPPPHESRLAFPITSSKENFADAVRRKRLFGLSDQVVAEIKRAQPYNRTDVGGEMLTRLRDLNDPEKHRKLAVAVFAVNQPKDIRIGPVSGPFNLEITGEALYDGAPLARVDFPNPHPPVNVQLDLTMRVRLADEPPGGPAVVSVLQQIREEVVRLLRVLRP